MNNRNCTPEPSNAPSLRPPSSRAVGTGHGLRASADMASMTNQTAANRIRPSSDFYGQGPQGQGQGNAELDPQDKLAQQWIADIDQYETTLEEMAAATLDQDFKDELSAIEQWFRVLSEAERTAALYALLQQTTQVQIRFFIQVLQQMGKNHPMSGVLSPANLDKDPMANRLSDAMSKLNVDSGRPPVARPNAAGSGKRYSGLDPSTINMMFPDAAAAIATEKAKYTQQTGNPPTSHRNSTVETRSSRAGPTLSGPSDDANVPNPTSPWRAQDATRPKSSTGHAPMGQFVQPPLSARGGRSSAAGGHPAAFGLTVTGGDQTVSDLPLFSPMHAGSGNWASMVNTPMQPNFAQNQPPAQAADMVANATAMKLAALSTVNNRFALDDMRKYRRARSNEAPGQASGPLSPHAPGLASGNMVMTNEYGPLLNRDQLIALQQQNLAFGGGGHRSRPNSPGMAMPNYGHALAFASPQNNGFLAAFDPNSPLINSGLAPMPMGQFGLLGPHLEGYLSDHSDLNRGRSPRGRRGTSKPPEDPTDATLLQDVPSWLRSLRLHKYTDNLKDLKWTDLVELDDKQLEDRGVNALGARRKMLKVFEQVKEAKAEGKIQP